MLVHLQYVDANNANLYPYANLNTVSQEIFGQFKFGLRDLRSRGPSDYWKTRAVEHYLTLKFFND